MRMTKIQLLEGKIHLLSGLHIGAGGSEMHIGGTDNPVIRHPVTREPYIPGSSLKGKMRSLLEWRAGLPGITEGKPMSFKKLKEVKDRPQAEAILKLFGCAGDDEPDAGFAPARLAFWDCGLDKTQVRKGASFSGFTEVKMENTIDRIKGTAMHPRTMERVTAGTEFIFRLTIRQFSEDKADLLVMVLDGLKMLEMDSIGGSGSRGYGKIEFLNLTLDHDATVWERFQQSQPFGNAA